mgnify:CR=1 FL=1
MVKDELKKLIDDVHYLIVAHCKYKDMSMYLGALKQFQEDIKYGQLEEVSYDERFSFLIGFETSLKAIDNAITLNEQLKENPDMIKSFSSLLPQQEDTWEMKCPYKKWDKYYYVDICGEVNDGEWEGYNIEKAWWQAGSIFLTFEAAELESKRRNLLTRFRAFRDECNGDWKIDLKRSDNKFYISYSDNMLGLCVYSFGSIEGFNLFGCFKNKEDAERAIKLFGDEIIELFVKGDA